MIAAALLMLSSCTTQDNKPPEEEAASAVLAQISEGPDVPPGLLVSGSLLFPVEFHWVSKGQLHTADVPHPVKIFRV